MIGSPGGLELPDPEICGGEGGGPELEDEVSVPPLDDDDLSAPRPSLLPRLNPPRLEPPLLTKFELIDIKLVAPADELVVVSAWWLVIFASVPFVLEFCLLPVF